MKKTVLIVRETVTNIYNFEINSEDYNEDMIDTLGDMLEEDYRNCEDVYATDYVIDEFMENIGMEEKDYCINCCIDEGNYVEIEIEDLFVVGN